MRPLLAAFFLLATTAQAGNTEIRCTRVGAAQQAIREYICCNNNCFNLPPKTCTRQPTLQSTSAAQSRSLSSIRLSANGTPIPTPQHVVSAIQASVPGCDNLNSTVPEHVLTTMYGGSVAQAQMVMAEARHLCRGNPNTPVTVYGNAQVYSLPFEIYINSLTATSAVIREHDNLPVNLQPEREARHFRVSVPSAPQVATAVYSCGGDPGRGANSDQVVVRN